MWGLFDLLLTLLMLFGIGGGLVWAAYAVPRELPLQALAAAAIAFGSLILWVGLENRGRASRLNRRCPVCGERLRLAHDKGPSVASASAECRWCGGGFVWKASRSRFGAGRWRLVSRPKRPPTSGTPR